MYELALALATQLHNGQRRKVTNEEYIVHPIRVSERVHTPFQKICALLHDTVEDTDFELEEIQQWFGSKVADTIDCLTHRKGESYDDYITRVLTNPDAVAVKIADICDNLNDYPSENLLRKSFKALPRLYNIQL